MENLTYFTFYAADCFTGNRRPVTVKAFDKKHAYNKAKYKLSDTEVLLDI